MKIQYHRASGDRMLLKALLLSILIHGSVIYFLPVFENLPAEVGYIEVERLEIASPDQAVSETAGDIPDTGAAPARRPAGQLPTLAQIPTQLEPIEPEIAARIPETNPEDIVLARSAALLPENAETLPQRGPFKSEPIEPGPLEPQPKPVVAAETPPKQAPPTQDVALQPELLAQAELPAVAAQWSVPLRSQLEPDAVEQVDPGFTQRQAPTLFERPAPAEAAPQPIARRAPEMLNVPRFEPLPAATAAARLPVPPPLTPVEINRQGVSLPPEPELLAQVELPTPAAQRSAPLRSQPESNVPEQVGPGFTQRQAPTLLERPAPAEVAPQPIERRAPEMLNTLGFEPLPTATAAARLPVPPPLLTPVETNLADARAAVPEYPNQAARTRHFQPPRTDTPEPENLRNAALPQFTPTSEPPQMAAAQVLRLAPRANAELPHQELPRLSTPFPLPPETKAAILPTPAAPEKPTLPGVETPAQAVSQPLPNKARPPAASLQSPTDAPRMVHVPQELQPTADMPREPELGIALPRTATTRDEALNATNPQPPNLVKSSLPGIVAPKVPTPLSPQQPDRTLQQDEVITHIAAAPGKEDVAIVIEGPAAQRRVLSKPPRLPDVQIEMAVVLRLKFWVLPDGTVGEVIPLQRGDVRLERAAIQYLKSWRFTPVASDQPAVWGIVPIKYKLK